ncbi:ankyrin repeat domain-containing protein [Cupriavidus gilardii]|uniref:ankyrin repeat domain-containing protein n=1 Tax=Cupriavidus gilardii TaxID=82541 RepID=UPI0015746F00|nr:ankyrin repeat domain-containing protein [Cupriavidus gilardii]NSX06840.1 ankyrin repeat domain-containing protein [Cupriavidus gilardii]
MVLPTRSFVDAKPAGAPGGASTVEGAAVAALHAAIARGDVAAIDTLAAAQPALLRLPDRDGNTALHLALLSGGEWKAVERLLQHGADPALTNANGDTALHLAFQLRPAAPQLVRALLRQLEYQGTHAARLALSARNADRQPPVALAADPLAGDAALTATIGELVSDYLDWLGRSGTDELAHAAGSGDVAQLQPWLARAESLSLPLSPRGHGALAIAAGRGHLAAMRELIAAAQPHGAWLIDVASFPDGETPLARAATFGQREAVALLLAHGAAVDGRDAARRTPLMRAAVYGHAEVAATLLAAGADPLACQAEGWTPLGYAAAALHPKVMATLLAHGAADGLHQRNAAMRTPLLLAAGSDELGRSPGLRMRTVDLLLRAGAGVDAADQHGMTALMLSARAGDAAVVRLLLEAGANALLRNAKGHTALTLAQAAGRREVVALLAEASPASD